MMNLICKVRGHNDDESDYYPRKVTRSAIWTGLEVWRCSRCRSEFQRTPRDTGLFTRDVAPTPTPKPPQVEEDAFYPATSFYFPEPTPTVTRPPVFESGGGGDFGGGGAESTWKPEPTRVVESRPEPETCSRSSWSSDSSDSYSSDSSSSDSSSSSSSD